MTERWGFCDNPECLLCATKPRRPDPVAAEDSTRPLPTSGQAVDMPSPFHPDPWRTEVRSGNPGVRRYTPPDDVHVEFAAPLAGIGDRIAQQFAAAQAPMLGAPFGKPIQRPRPWYRRFRVFVEPRAVWVGVDFAESAIYVCPLPMLVVKWTR